MSELDNPYAPPTADEVFQPTGDSFVYQPTEGLSAALRILLGISVAILVIDVWSFMMQVDLLERAQRGQAISLAEANANDQRVVLLTGVFLLALLATAIVWCIWQNRMNKNAQALGAGMMQFGPNAWGWFFCPVVNLWRPVSVISELWTATLPDAASGESASGWRGIAAPNWLLGGWWLPWLLGGIINNISTRMLGDLDDLGSLITGSQLQVVANALLAVSGVFAIVLVTMLQRRVQARAAQRRDGKRSAHANGLL